MKTIIKSIVTPLSILSYWGVYLLGLYGDLDLWIVAIIISVIAIVEITVLQITTILSME